MAAVTKIFTMGVSALGIQHFGRDGYPSAAPSFRLSKLQGAGWIPPAESSPTRTWLREVAPCL